MLRRPLAFLILLSGCATTQPLIQPAAVPETLPRSIYESVPQGKSLRAIPQFFLVDDFNSRSPKNALGVPWEIEGATRRELRFRFLPLDGFDLKRGSSLRFKVSLPAGKQGAFKSSLKAFDLSQAQAVVLKCRIQPQNGKPFLGTLELTLKDLRDYSQAHDFSEACLSGERGFNGWREVVIPRARFSEINWDQLKELALVFRAGPEPLRAQVGIDEISFYGKGDLKLESQKDNLVGFPPKMANGEGAKALLAEPTDEKFLYQIARDTWKYFENSLDRNTHLPVDHIRVSDPGGIGSYTTPTNLAMYFFACIAAHELGIISKKEAVKRIGETFETLRLMKRWQGVHYNFYDTGNLQVTRPYVSVIDLGWLAASWIVVRQAFPKELGGLATRFLQEVDFNEFYDPSIRQLYLGFDEAAGNFSPYHYGLIATEARVASLIGIGKGDLPEEHWWSIYRTPPQNWTWQNQIPQGKEVEIDGNTVLEGYYTYEGKKFVPSWGGSLFEFLMPSLVIKEKELAPQSFGLNNRIATEIQMDYALNRQKYPVWGISPASTASGRLWTYGEYGVKYLGVKGYRDESIITPYASFLALETLPDHAIANVRRMLELYPIYGEYGFYDSINLVNGRVNAQYLTLDQGMILTAVANYLKRGVLKEYFHRDAIGKKAETLLEKERFFD